MPERLVRARAAVDRALALDSTLADAHASLGLILTNHREFAAAEREYRKAIGLNPSYPWSHHFFSMLLMITGRVEESLKESDRVLELDPLSLAGNANRGAILCMARDLSATRKHLARALELQPDFPLALYYQGEIAASEQRYAEAIGPLRRTWELAPGFPGVIGALAFAYAGAGQKAAADSLLRRLNAQRPDSRARFNLGMLYAMRGESAAALEQLKDAYYSLASLVNLRADPQLARLRADAGYAGLLQRLGL